MVVVGEVLFERYRIDRILGTGGMGIVMAATDTQTQHRVALKRLTPERSDDGEAIERMRREAEALTRLTGRHTQRILDVRDTGDGDPVMVMELLEGEDLGQVLTRRGRLDEAEAADLVLQTCEGLAEAHSRQMIHRDIKPANLLLTRDVDGTDLVKVIDFGVVKHEVDSDPLTRTTSMVGSVAYMAPEQLRRLQVDARADVWSLGVVLYELVAGKHPFPADSITDASIRIAVEPALPAPDDVSVHFAAVISRCLEKAPSARYADVGALAEALVPFVPEGGERADRIRRILGRGTSSAPRPPDVSRRRGRAVRVRDLLARRWPLVSLGICIWSLGLLLASFAVDDRLNELSIGGKRTGYLASFNWTLVHTFFCPMTVAVIGVLLGATRRELDQLGRGLPRAWDRGARGLVLLWILLTAVLAVGYTIVEWRFVTTGRCDRGTFLGWPNQLCEVSGGSVATSGFMWLAAATQSLMLSVGWLLLSTVIWLCQLVFGRTAPRLDDAGYARVAGLFGIAAWGWAALFVALYIARLWSIHLRTPDTDGVIATVISGSPFAIDAHTQTDYGSMISGVIMLLAAVVPFVLLRLRMGTTKVTPVINLQRAVAVLGVGGLFSMVFPRLGVVVLTGIALVGLTIGSVRRALVAAWPR